VSQGQRGLKAQTREGLVEGNERGKRYRRSGAFGHRGDEQRAFIAFSCCLLSASLLSGQVDYWSRVESERSAGGQ
jgi:hypothetical protein